MSRHKRFFALLAALATVSIGGIGAPVSAAGATQVGGTISGFDCYDRPPEFVGEITYEFRVDGDLSGCVYGLVTDYRSHPSGTYQEVADEIFIGTYDGEEGTLEMTEFYTHKEIVPGSPELGLSFARCKHPVVAGSGTGVFAGVSGRLDFKDDNVAGTSEYKGHLRF